MLNPEMTATRTAQHRCDLMRSASQARLVREARSARRAHRVRRLPVLHVPTALQGRLASWYSAAQQTTVTSPPVPA